mgnify:FL=1
MSNSNYTKSQQKLIDYDPDIDPPLYVSTSLEDRRISKEVITRFEIRCDKTGWTYPVPGGGRRWKNYNSKGHPKYKWVNSKPESASFYHGPNLGKTVNQQGGEIWFVAGEPDVWAMHTAGIKNVFSAFSESHIPDEFISFLKELKIKKLYLAPDLDPAGSRWAYLVEDKLRDILIECAALELPRSLGEGGDIGKTWAIYEHDIPFNDWLKSLPEIEPVPSLGGNRNSANYFKEKQNKVPETYREMIIRHLGITDFKRDGNGAKNIKCPFHDDHHPSATLHQEIGLYCHACGRSYLWVEIARELRLPSIEEFQSTVIGSSKPGLSMQTRHALAQKNLTTVARIYDAFYKAGKKPGYQFTIANAAEVLSPFGISISTLYQVTNSSNTDTSQFFPSINDLKRKGEKNTKNKKKRGRILYLLSNKEIADLVGLDQEIWHLVEDDIPSLCLSSNKNYRIAMYRLFIRKNPGKHTRAYLASQLGVCNRTIRGYDKPAGILVSRNYEKDKLTPTLIKSLTNNRHDQPGHVWIEANGKKFPPTIEGAARAEEHHPEVFLVTQLENTYVVNKVFKLVKVGNFDE